MPRFCLLTLAAVALTSAAPDERVPSQPKVGLLAPGFTLKLVDGGEVTLGELRGNVIILNFWATWCVPCRAELPDLDYYHRMQRQHGLRAYAITTEGSLPLYRLKPLFAKMTIPSVRSVKGPYRPLGAIPTNIIIGRDGRVRYAQAGALNLDLLNKIVLPLLKEKAPAAE